jgi:hypothetical protein
MNDERHAAPAPADLLSVLDADRTALGVRARRPAWLAPALGAVTAAWITTSQTARSDSPSPWFFLFFVAMILVLVATRSTGVRLKGIGARGWVAYLALVVTGLLLYSTALALFSLRLDWWVAVPAVLMFVATVATVRVIDASARRSLDRDR